jgi:vitamin B12/bleomycin/antimicrobial peptide transport system ATP-binding/permease protein
MIKARLREWLTHDLLDQWLIPKRAYLLGFAGQIGTNPDQRIHQDAQHLTELTTTLAIGLLQSSLLLVSFVGVLWVLSQQIVFDVGASSFAIPGYLVWCALAYSLGGSLLGWRVAGQQVGQGGHVGLGQHVLLGEHQPEDRVIGGREVRITAAPGGYLKCMR